MQQMMDYQIWKQRHEELLREAEMNRQVRALLATGKRRAGRRSALAWELQRHAGRFRKRLKTLWNVG
ncbi:MAG: hypothetical protein M3324_10760 [Actinomycetota bacterium]|jgi:hypothetical protein|nr:hypothetical protein [Actinomycetota bacterium]